MADCAQKKAMLETFFLQQPALYLVGSFTSGVTVRSQQVRGLNLVWGLIELGIVPAGSQPARAGGSHKPQIAIVGGGFAGLSVAAGLIKKGANADITIFEQRDTLLPLQQGSDSRWLHPQIYNWPKEGSEASVAMLPVLNWNAARASDVVVQVLTEWKRIALNNKDVTLYCNARHLHIHKPATPSAGHQVEWIGEHRQPDGTVKDSSGAAEGLSKLFDFVILTVGFGLERGGAHSYWRNETFGQPSLDEPRLTYIVSGQGDGAMIDLLRLRISQFRQDRILSELFSTKTLLLDRIKELYAEHTQSGGESLFSRLEQMANDHRYASEFAEIRRDLTSRLRRDTEVILHLKVRKFSDLFKPNEVKMSFQNRLLVFLLYKCGGFVPSCAPTKALARQYSVANNRIIRRHGTKTEDHVNALLDEDIGVCIKRDAVPEHLRQQTDEQRWPGGYFGFPGPQARSGALDDSVRERWRKEYLPGPTSLLATSFCSSIAGQLLPRHSSAERLRITLHRAVVFEGEELLQQACEYVGTQDAGSNVSAGRTFPADIATIGLAYKCRQIVRSRMKITPADLKASMEHLELNTASRTMSDEVGFILAIPLLEPEEPGKFTHPAPVAGVVYIDSKDQDFYIDDDQLRVLVSMASHFLTNLEKPLASFDRLRNIPLAGVGKDVPPATTLPSNVAHTLELVQGIAPPRTSAPFQLNFDYSDFALVQE